MYEQSHNGCMWFWSGLMSNQTLVQLIACMPIISVFKWHLSLISPGCSQKGGVASLGALKIVALPGSAWPHPNPGTLGSTDTVFGILLQIHQKNLGRGQTPPPLLAIPGFWDLLDRQPLPYDCSLVKLINVICFPWGTTVLVSLFQSEIQFQSYCWQNVKLQQCHPGSWCRFNLCIITNLAGNPSRVNWCIEFWVPTLGIQSPYWVPIFWKIGSLMLSPLFNVQAQAINSLYCLCSHF